MVRKLKGGRTNGAGSQMDILKQAQVMQQQMMAVQEGLKEKELVASVGGGAVTVKVNGQKELLEVKFNDEIVKEAMRQADELAEAEMGKVTGGINIPGLF